MKYSSGDDLQTSVLDSAYYSKLRTARVRKVLRFVTSYSYESEVIKAALSSIPRWRYAREMGAAPKNDRPKNKATVEGGRSSSDDEHFEFASAPKDLR